MSFFWDMFRLSFLRRLRSPGSILFLAAVLALTVAMVLPPARQEAAVQVGLVLPRQGAEDLEQLLQQRSSGLIAFVPTDAQTMERKILSGSWDCALVVPEDFRQRLEALDTDGLLVLQVGPGSAVYPLVRETAAACLTELLVPYLSEDYMRRAGMDPENLELALGQLTSVQRVEVQLQTLEGEALSLPQLTRGVGKQLLRNLSALMLLIWGLYLAVDMGRFLESPVAVRLRPVRSGTAMVLPQLLAGMALPAAWVLAVQLLLGFGPAQLASAAGYCLAVTALALLIARLKPLWQAVPALAPFLVVACLVLEPVLVDGVLLIRATRWLPVSLYCRGDWPAAALLLAEGWAFGALALLADRRGRMFSAKMRRGD